MCLYSQELWLVLQKIMMVVILNTSENTHFVYMYMALTGCEISVWHASQDEMKDWIYCENGQDSVCSAGLRTWPV